MLDLPVVLQLKLAPADRLAAELDISSLAHEDGAVETSSSRQIGTGVAFGKQIRSASKAS